MSDERLFRETMASLGVTPLNGPAPKPQKQMRPASQKERAENQRQKRAARQVRTTQTTAPASQQDEDDALFLQAMSSLARNSKPSRNLRTTSDTPQDVPPTSAAPSSPPPRLQTVSEPLDPDDTLFLDSMRRLDSPHDKDRGRRHRAPSLSRVERLKPAKHPVSEPEASLDLHGHTVDEGLEKLTHFITSARQGGMKIVLVVTGKGLRSATGRGVLREAVERWLQRDGRRMVRAFSEAARAQGGRGAFVVLLR